VRLRRECDIEQPDSRQSLFTSLSRTFTGTLAPISNFASSAFMPRASTFQPEASMNASPSPAGATAGSSSKPPPFVRKIKIFMYNYGSPKVGNGNFANFYDKMVPASYRVVVDGDIVPALPPQSKYSHIGTEILIDSVGAGSIIIDPSFVERWLRTHMKSSVAVHSLLVYRKGLLGIKLAAEFMRANADKSGTVDPLRLALSVRTHHQVDSILDENAGIGADLETREAECDCARGSLIGNANDRANSVSDEVNAKVPCLPPLEERESPSPAIDLELLSPVEEGAAGEPGVLQKQPSGRAEETMNPMAASMSRQTSKRAAEAATASSDTNSATVMVDREHAAQHYAHDVEQMEILRQQMAAMRTPGPVRWMQEAASIRLPLRGRADKTGEEPLSTGSSKASTKGSTKGGKKGSQKGVSGDDFV
jgi:hypothetical protein